MSRIRGVSKLRQRLRDIGPELNKHVRTAIEQSADEMISEIQSRTPIHEGDLIRSVTKVIRPDGLSAYVGPGIKGAMTIKRRTGSFGATVRFSGGRAVDLQSGTGRKLNFSRQTRHDRFQMMKAYWLEHGTKGRKDKSGRYIQGSAMPATHFVSKSREVMRHRINGRIKRAVSNALKRV